MIIANFINGDFSFKGALLENHREVWISSTSVGSVHHAKWRLSIADKLKIYECMSNKKVHV